MNQPEKEPVAPTQKIDTPVIIYILYLAGLVLGGITILIGAIWAYIEKPLAIDWLQSHYDFMINTFWKGLIFVVVGVLLLPVGIGSLVLLFFIAWLIVRCVKGIRLLRRRESVEDPKRWGF